MPKLRRPRSLVSRPFWWPIAVQLLPVGEDLGDVVQRVRPLRMARDLRHLPGRQVRVDVLGELLALFVEAADLFGDVDRRFALHESQFFDLGLEFGDRLLEVEEMSFAHAPVRVGWIVAREARVNSLPAADPGYARCTRWPPSGTAPRPRPARAPRRATPARR